MVHYDELAARYADRLSTQLRRFQAGGEGSTEAFLDLWVYDDDPNKSLLNLFEAAATGGLDSLTVELGPTSVDLAALKKQSEGIATFQTTADGRRLDVTLSLRTARATEVDVLPTRRARTSGVHPNASPVDPASVVYADRTRIVLAQGTPHGRSLPREETSDLRIEVTDSEWRLQLDVDPETHVVRRAAWKGPAAEIERAILEVACTTMEGRPLPDAGDHAAIRTENALRDPLRLRVVSGVVTPRNAHPAFSRLETLIRRAVSRFREETGQAPSANHFDPEPTAAWLALSEEAARARVQTTLDAAVRDLGLPAAECLRIRKGHHVCLTLAERGAAGGHALMQLERVLQDTLDPALVCELEPRRDKSPIRRL